MKYSNMKIKVENNLDEIVAELCKKGYESVGFIFNPNCDFVVQADQYGYFTVLFKSDYPLTTLAELKEMKQ